MNTFTKNNKPMSHQQLPNSQDPKEQNGLKQFFCKHAAVTITAGAKGSLDLIWFIW